MSKPWYLSRFKEAKEVRLLVQRAVAATRLAYFQEHHVFEGVNGVEFFLGLLGSVEGSSFVQCGDIFGEMKQEDGSPAALFDALLLGQGLYLQEIPVPSFRGRLRERWRSLDELLETKKIDFKELGLVSASVIRSVAVLAKRRAVPDCIPVHQVLVDLDKLDRPYLACARCAYVPSDGVSPVQAVREALLKYFKTIETLQGQGFSQDGKTIEQWLQDPPPDLDELADWLEGLADWVATSAGLKTLVLYVDSANVLRQRDPRRLRWGRVARKPGEHFFPNERASGTRIVVARRTGDQEKHGDFFKSLTESPTLRVLFLRERGGEAGDQADDIEIAAQMTKDLKRRNVAQTIFLSNDKKFWSEHMNGWHDDPRVRSAEMTDLDVKEILDTESHRTWSVTARTG